MEGVDTNLNEAGFSCLTDSCVDLDSSEFTAAVVPDGLKAGATYDVSIFGSTGLSKGTPTVYSHIERLLLLYFVVFKKRIPLISAPKPVENLATSFIGENHIKFSWDPPSGSSNCFTSFFLNFTNAQNEVVSANVSV